MLPQLDRPGDLVVDDDVLAFLDLALDDAPLPIVVMSSRACGLPARWGTCFVTIWTFRRHVNRAVRALEETFPVDNPCSVIRYIAGRRYAPGYSGCIARLRRARRPGPRFPDYRVVLLRTLVLDAAKLETWWEVGQNQRGITG